MKWLRNGYWVGFLSSGLWLGLPSLVSQAQMPPVLDASQSGAVNAYRQGQSMLALNSFPQAVYHFQQAAALYQAEGNQSGEQESLLQLALAEYYLADYAEAQRHLQQVERSPLGQPQQGRVAILKGLIFLELGEIDQAISPLSQVASLGFDDLADTNRLQIAWGQLSRYRGQYTQALAYLSLASRTSQQWANRAKALSGLGDIYFDLGDYPQAVAFYQQSLDESRAAGYALGTAQGLSNLGRIYVRQQHYADAVQAYLEAYDLYRGLGDWVGLGRVLNNLGEVYTEQSQLDKALVAYQEAAELANQLGAEYSRALNGLGRLALMKGDFDEADQSFQAAHVWASDNNDQGQQLQALGGRAEVYIATQAFPEAEHLLSEAIEQFEGLEPGLRDLEKVSLFETQSYLYELMQQTLVAQGHPEAALVVAEQGRARAFRELLANQAVQAEPTTLMTLAQMRELAASQNSTLVQYSIIRRASPGRSRYDDQTLFIWVIQPTGQIHFQQVDLANAQGSLEALVKAGQDDLGVRGFSPWFGGQALALANPVDGGEESLRQLYRLLIEPIAPFLPESPTAKVVFVPQGSLFLVPFAALQPAQDTVLIEAHTMSVAPSLQVLDLLRQRHASQSGEALVVGMDRQAVIVGNPTMPVVPPPFGETTQALIPLPGAEAEAVAIAPLLNATPLIGTAATEHAVKAKLASAQVIHLATHGLLDERQGLQSAVALGPSGMGAGADQAEDGLLTAEEVLDLRLQADLVVLSACNTGRGRITGDGVVGLSRSFLAAGAENLVASLWSVPDEATALLMTQFYQHLQSGQGKAEALRLAMLETKAQYPHPRDWAAFFLVGLE